MRRAFLISSFQTGNPFLKEEREECHRYRHPRWGMGRIVAQKQSLLRKRLRCPRFPTWGTAAQEEYPHRIVATHSVTAIEQEGHVSLSDQNSSTLSVENASRRSPYSLCPGLLSPYTLCQKAIRWAAYAHRGLREPQARLEPRVRQAQLPLELASFR